jgi:hypothetical protein
MSCAVERNGKEDEVGPLLAGLCGVDGARRFRGAGAHSAN